MTGRVMGGGSSDRDDNLDPEDAPVRVGKSLADEGLAPDDAPARPAPVRPSISPTVVAVTPEPAPGSSVRSSHPVAPTVPARQEAPFGAPSGASSSQAEPSVEYAPPDWRPASYTRASVQPVDAPVAQDLFGEGGFEEFDSLGPPTEEGPAQVMEDVGQPYTTPYSVPEPPPIPGILDRFTPSPTQRTEIGSRRKKPDYLGGDAAQVKDFRPTPAPGRRKERPKTAPSARGPIEPQHAEPPPRSTGSTVLAVIGVLFGLVGIGSLAASGLLFWLANQSPDPDEQEPPRTPVAGGVEVRETIGDRDPTAPVPPGPAPQAPSPTPEPPALAPVEAPKPPTPEPPAPAPAAAAAKGTLKIRSNRKVLVYLDDKVLGYTPQTVQVEPGKYSILAMMPGQPNTKQARNANVAQAGSTVNVDFSF